jgi:hypothetical protein
MLRMSARAVFDDRLAEDELLITSIVTQVLGHKANIAWRLPYAVDQDAGVDQKTGNVYRHYTTPGTGPHFKDKALNLTIRQVDPMFRELGLTK